MAPQSSIFSYLKCNLAGCLEKFLCCYFTAWSKTFIFTEMQFFIRNILQLFLKLHEYHLPQTALTWLHVFVLLAQDNGKTGKSSKSYRWKPEKSKRVTSSHIRKHLLDLITACSGPHRSFQRAADCSQLLYNTVMKHAAPLSVSVQDSCYGPNIFCTSLIASST